MPPFAAGLTNGLGWVTMNNSATLAATVQSARFRISCVAPGATLANAFLDDIFFGTGLTPVDLLALSIE